ncbi:hypothetical protein VNO77_09874 [Canavalia gladiata]|uniref:J domain-containing protein n=1 Tax=Canavalia gladiata TaxID=3824 RepID=A0AAN9M9L3_CANGL
MRVFLSHNSYDVGEPERESTLARQTRRGRGLTLCPTKNDSPLNDAVAADSFNLVSLEETLSISLPRYADSPMAKLLVFEDSRDSLRYALLCISFHSLFVSEMEEQIQLLYSKRRIQNYSSFVSCIFFLKSNPNHIKYITRQKRADAKKALNSLLYNSGSSKFSFEDNWYGDQGRHSNKGQSKSGGKPQKKTKRKIRRESFSEDFDGHHEQIFHATFGNRWYTWSFNNWRGGSEHSTSGFEWREHSNRTNKWKTASDAENDDDDMCCVGSSSDRTILGLPSTGPLKIEDVKNAFRLSALKWHPDKHQGPSQIALGRRWVATDIVSMSPFLVWSRITHGLGFSKLCPFSNSDYWVGSRTSFALSGDEEVGTAVMSFSELRELLAMAEEKFKLCVNAYKTLCNALSPS